MKVEVSSGYHLVYKAPSSLQLKKSHTRNYRHVSDYPCEFPIEKKKHKRKYKNAGNTVRKQEQQEDFISAST